MKRSLRTNEGFTIVELLIVIVIIAILATLLFLTYNGIQTNARNNQTAQAVSQYRKALISYATEKGEYPILDYNVCIGSSYPDLNSDGSADCRYGNITSGGFTIHPDSWFNQQIRKYMNNSVARPQATISSTANKWAGAYFSATPDNEGPPKLDGKNVNNWIAYVIEGNNAKCPIGPVYKASGSWDNFVSPPALNTRQDSGSTGVECWLPLPNISDL